MSSGETATGVMGLMPGMRYRNLDAAIAWLGPAFGFEEHSVARDESGAAIYAELTFGASMVMLAAVKQSELDKLMRQPDEAGGETQSCYLVVGDADTHYARAKAAGAEIVLDIEDQDAGRSFSCRDPEGHLWTFGTYDPWWRRQDTAKATPEAPTLCTAEHSDADREVDSETLDEAVDEAFGQRLDDLPVYVDYSRSEMAPAAAPGLRQFLPKAEPREAATAASETAAEAREPVASPRGQRHGARRAVVAAYLVFALVPAAALGWLLGVSGQPSQEAAATQAHAAAASERQARAAADRAVLAAQDQLAEERAAKGAVQGAVDTATEALAKERAARSGAEQAAAEARTEAARLGALADGLERDLQKARDDLSREETLRALAESGGPPDGDPIETGTAKAEADRITRLEADKAAAEGAATKARAELAGEREAKAAVERRASDAAEALAAERKAREKAGVAAREIELQLAGERRAKETAEAAVREAKAALATEQDAKATALAAVQRLRRQLTARGAAAPAPRRAPRPLRRRQPKVTDDNSGYADY